MPTFTLQGPAFVAMFSKWDGWLNPGFVANTSVVQFPLDTSAGHSNPGAGPPNKSNYTPVTSAKAKVVREYGGINSSGGPQQTGRADQTDFEIVMKSHDASPVLYDHCCAGIQLKWVHLVVPGGEADTHAFMHIRMEDVNITGYRMSGVRKFYHLTFDPPDNYRAQDYDVYDIVHSDRLTLLYTSLSFMHYGTAGTEGGWNTGSDASYRAGDDEITVPPAAPAPAPAPTSTP